MGFQMILSVEGLVTTLTYQLFVVGVSLLVSVEGGASEKDRCTALIVTLEYLLPCKACHSQKSTNTSYYNH